MISAESPYRSTTTQLAGYVAPPYCSLRLHHGLRVSSADPRVSILGCALQSIPITRFSDGSIS